MSTQRILLLGYIVLGVLVGLTLDQLVGGLLGRVSAFGFLGHELFGIEGWTWSTMLGFAIALGLALFCWKDARVRGPATQVVEELQRVSWPTRAETRAATIAVIVATAIISIILGAFDYVWAFVTQRIYDPIQ